MINENINKNNYENTKSIYIEEKIKIKYNVYLLIIMINKL